jgi:hypothetical protein
MIDALKQMLASKKAIAAFTAAILTAAGQAIGMDSESINQLIAPIVAYILGQGIADFGKSASQ